MPVAPNSITVRVKLYGMLRRQWPVEAEGSNRQPFVMSLPTGVTVVALLTELDISHGYVGAVAINGYSAGVDALLHDGDEVRLFPPSAGG